MTIARELGERLRAYRTQRGWSQEELAERADLHTTYIGQLECGEKNATIESISKVAAALNISLSKLFENISLAPSEKDIPSRCYDLIQKQPLRDQKLLLDILDTVVAYKKQ
ncbi:helix-turn-helix transcriptional regulator [Oscillibacter valericigenes]|nr:helix-turn-helix transcriptional regulator [Oscillibacter valericigenes]